VNSAAAVLIGSLLSAVVAIFIMGLQASLERRRRSHIDRTERLANFLSASYAAGTAIGALARAPIDEKRAADEAIRQAEEGPLNASLTRLHLLEEAEILQAATAIDRELTRLPGLAMEKQWTRDDWRHERKRLNELTIEFEIVARRKLGVADPTTPPDLYAPKGIADSPDT
jgi:hypothetical protein